MKFSTKDEFTQEDWDLIIHLDESFFDYPWKRKQWEEIENNPNYYIILDEAGFILFHLGIDEAHLLKILVEPNSRKQGIAQVLLQKAIKELEIQNIFLEVVEDNDAAIAFYEKNGFKKLHLAKNYYSDGKNAWKMQLNH